jgi:hypothetical protein
LQPPRGEKVKNEDIRLLVATDAACEGLNLQRLGSQMNVDPKWFKKGSTRVAPNVAAPKRALSLTEQAALKAFQESHETGVRLIRKGETKKPKKRLGKPKARARNPPVIRPDPSLPQKASARATARWQSAEIRRSPQAFATGSRKREVPLSGSAIRLSP